jgi:hypothetical protein
MPIINDFRPPVAATFTHGLGCCGSMLGCACGDSLPPFGDAPTQDKTLIDPVPMLVLAGIIYLFWFTGISEKA